MESEILAGFKVKLSMTEPVSPGLPEASVSLVFRGEDDPRLLLIRRAEAAGDPWSGQVAFPGGKARPGENSLKETAIRETGEEVGIDLSECADFLGYFGPFVTHTGTMAVTPAVFMLRKDVEVKTNSEVASHKWVDLRTLKSPGVKGVHSLQFQGAQREMPAFLVGDYVVWGLTYRMITALLDE